MWTRPMCFVQCPAIPKAGNTLPAGSAMPNRRVVARTRSQCGLKIFGLRRARLGLFRAVTVVYECLGNQCFKLLQGTAVGDGVVA